MDTNLGHVDLEDFRKRMYGTDGRLPTPIAMRMMRNGIVHAAGFPPAKECPELMVECALRYNARDRQIEAPDGRVLSYLSEPAIQETFGIPVYNRTSYRTKQDALKLYQSQQDLCASNINKNWLLKPKPTTGKMPKKLIRTHFKEEYGDIVLLLNRIIGHSHGAPFENWMYYFIDEIITGVKMFNWSKMISDSLHEQLVNFEETKTFHMSSYIVYSLARYYKYPGLTCKGVVGNGEGQFKAYDCYLQLQLKEKSHFRRAHDAFLMYITRLLQGGTHQRLSHEAKSLISRYGF